MNQAALTGAATTALTFFSRTEVRNFIQNKIQWVRTQLNQQQQNAGAAAPQLQA